jgi:phage terminase small subunit
MAESKRLTPKQEMFVNEYLQCWSAAEAARRAGYSERTAREQGYDLLTKPHIQEVIRDRLDETHLSADEVLANLGRMARGDMGHFFKVTDEWMFNPPPTSEILDEREVVDDSGEKPVKRISYRVRRVILDLDRLMDPQYSYLVRRFSDRGRRGMSIEIHDAKSANELIGKHHKLFTDRVEVDHRLHVEGLDASLEKIYGSRDDNS